MNEYICINDTFTSKQKEIFETLPVKGERYTLKEIVKSPIDNKEGFVFYELPNPCHPNGQEYSFRPSRFAIPKDNIEEEFEIQQTEIEHY